MSKGYPEDCDQITVNQNNRIVGWNGGAGVSHLAGSDFVPLRLRSLHCS